MFEDKNLLTNINYANIQHTKRRNRRELNYVRTISTLDGL